MSLGLLLLRYALVMALFVLPGWAVSRRLLRREGLPGVAHWPLGFAWSAAVCAAVGWPFLWYGWSFAGFLRVLYPVWGAWSLLGLAAFVATRRAPRSRHPDEAPDGWPIVGAERDARGSDEPTSLPLIPALGATAVIVLASVLWAFHLAGAAYLVILPATIALGAVSARRLARAAGPLLALGPVDHRAPPRAFVVFAGVFLAAQVVLTTAWSRPDWDDCMYLAAVVDYQQAAALNAEEPTHREGLAVPAAHRTLTWELWGAVVARLTGADAMTLFHTLLPPLLVLLAYAAYAALLREWLSRRWLPLAVAMLSAFHLWGISGHEVAANFLLPRPWQGKSVLLHIALPLTALLVMRFCRRPSWGLWLSLSATVAFGLAASLSAVFAVAPLLVCLAPLVLLSDEDSRSLRARVGVLAATGVTLWPLAWAALAVRQAIAHELAMQGQPERMSSWWSAASYVFRHGGIEVAWLAALPILWVLLDGLGPRDARYRRAYLVGLPVLLALTFANPLLFDVVARGFTSYHTYPRLWWLLPVGAGYATLAALLARLAARIRPWRHPERVAVAVVAAQAAILFAMPGSFVFGPSNSKIGPLGMPALAETLEKMPAGLRHIARLLDEDPAISSKRILCVEGVASFLTPWSRAFRFVQTRTLYTPMMFAAAGRPVEGLERHLLAESVLTHDRVSPVEDERDWRRLREIYGARSWSSVFAPAAAAVTRDTQALMDRYQVRYAITSPGDHADEGLAATGFVPLARDGAFTLWKR